MRRRVLQWYTNTVRGGVNTGGLRWHTSVYAWMSLIVVVCMLVGLSVCESYHRCICVCESHAVVMLMSRRSNSVIATLWYHAIPSIFI